MKKLFTLLLITTLIACSSDDDNTVEEPQVEVEVTNASWEVYDHQALGGEDYYMMRISATVTNNTNEDVTGKLLFRNGNINTGGGYLYSETYKIEVSESIFINDEDETTFLTQEQIDRGFEAEFVLD